MLFLWNKKKSYLGAARGFVGILYTLLGLSRKEWELIETTDIPNARDRIRQTIDHLLQDETCLHLSSSGNLRPVTNSTIDIVDWSYGDTGLVLLLIRASQVFQEMEYLERARALCETVLWKRGIEDVIKGVGLTLDVPDWPLHFLQLSVHSAKTLSTLWQRRALYYVQWAAGQC
jgi:hypothetical protein